MILSTRASLLSGVLAALAMSGCDTTPVNNNPNYMPEQPIAFSPAVHAGHYEIDCQYCHVGAEKSRHAGVPPRSPAVPGLVVESSRSASPSSRAWAPGPPCVSVVAARGRVRSPLFERKYQ